MGIEGPMPMPDEMMQSLRSEVAGEPRGGEINSDTIVGVVDEIQNTLKGFQIPPGDEARSQFDLMYQNVNRQSHAIVNEISGKKKIDRDALNWAVGQMLKTIADLGPKGEDYRPTMIVIIDTLKAKASEIMARYPVESASAAEFKEI